MSITITKNEMEKDSRKKKNINKLCIITISLIAKRKHKKIK